jgi:hypothetical protein
MGMASTGKASTPKGLAILSGLVFALSAVAHLAVAVAVVRFAAPAPYDLEPEAGIEVELVAPAEAARDEAKADEKPDETPEQTLDLKDEPKAEAKSEPKPESKTEPKTEPKVEPKTESKPEPAAPPAAESAAAPPPERQETPPPRPAPQQAPSQPAPAPAEQAAEQPAEPDLPEPPFAPEMMAQMSKLNRAGEFDEAATEKAKLTAAEIAAFKAAVQACWTPPPGVTAEPKLKVVIRVSFKRNGALAGEPMLIAGTASRLGPVLMRAAQDAVRRCQPYAVLPPAKYQEWRMLDLAFSPAGISGG